MSSTSPGAFFARLLAWGSRRNWKWDLPSWQAHRGYHLEGIPENGLEALIAAREKGARMCEFDVRLTKDQVPILFHDPDLQRMTGREGHLIDITLHDLRGLTQVTTLEDVLRSDRVPKYLNIEIKSEEIWNDPLERRIQEVLKKTGGFERVLFSSFNPFSLWKMQSFCPSVPRALLVAKDMKQKALREMWLAPLLNLQALHLESVLLPDRKSIRYWQKRGFRVAVWTVNDQEQIHQYWDWGVDSVITDLIPERKNP